jgi:predicted DNA-binding protein with PD1-like motif
MRYQVGQIGRVVIMRLEDGDDVISCISTMAKKEGIKAAVIYLLGGLKSARIVVGPEKEGLPPVPVWREIKESHEIIGIGSIFYQGEEPKVHLHAAFGKGDVTKVGCVRERSETFLIIEAVIIELNGLDATRELDPETGLSLLRL